MQKSGSLSSALLASFALALLLVLHSGVRLLDAQRVPGAGSSEDVYALRAVSGFAGPAEDGKLPQPLVTEALAGLLPSGRFFGITSMRATLARGSASRPVEIEFVEGDLFRTLGVAFAHGGHCADARDVVISWQFYREALAAPANPIGIQLPVNGRNPDPDQPVLLRVCGVANPEFVGIHTGRRVDVWAPWKAWPNLLLPAFETEEAIAGFFPLEVFLRADSFDQARAIANQVEAIALHRGDIEPDAARIVAEAGIAVDPARRKEAIQQGRLLVIVSLLLGLVVVLGVLARVALDAVKQGRSDAIRSALGESSARRTQRQAAESFLQFSPAVFMAALLAIALLWFAGRVAHGQGYFWLGELLAGFAYLDDVLLGALVAIVALPILAFALKLSIRGAGSLGSRGSRFRIVALPVILALTGLAGVVAVATSAIFESMRLQNQDFGINARGLVISTANAPADKGEIMARLVSRRPIAPLEAQMEERLPANVALASAAPFGSPTMRELQLDGSDKRVPVYVNAVSANYFRLLDIAVEGLLPTRDDPDSVAVNRAFVRRYLGTNKAIGEQLRLVEPTRGSTQVVRIGAVVDDAQRLSPREPVIPVVYLALTDERDFNVVIASDDAAAEAIAQAEAFLQAQFPSWAMTSATPLDRSIQEAFATERLQSALLVVTAVLLALIGAYGMAIGLRAVIVERASEMAVRRALGGSAARLAISALGVTPLSALLATGVLLALPLALAFHIHPEQGAAARVMVGMSGLLMLLLAAAVGIRAGFSRDLDITLMRRLKEDSI